MPPLPSTARQVQADAIVVKHGMSVITSELPSALTVQSPTKAKAPAVVGGSFGRRRRAQPPGSGSAGGGDDGSQLRVSSRKLAARAAGYGAAAPSYERVQLALMDMLSADWTAPAAGRKHTKDAKRARTSPQRPKRPQHGRRAQSVDTQSGAEPRPQLVSDPHGCAGGLSGADPPRWSGAPGTGRRQPGAAQVKPFGGEARFQAQGDALALGPGDIDTQVAAIAEHIRAAQERQSTSDASPTHPPRDVRRTLAVPHETSPTLGAPTDLRVAPARRPMGRPRVADTAEDRARAAAVRHAPPFYIALLPAFLISRPCRLDPFCVVQNPFWDSRRFRRDYARPAGSSRSETWTCLRWSR